MLAIYFVAINIVKLILFIFNRNRSKAYCTLQLYYSCVDQQNAFPIATVHYSFHDALCHPGVTRMVHFVGGRNLRFSVDEIKKMTNKCKICARVKPRYAQRSRAHTPQTTPPLASHTPLIKAPQPFERLSIDFNGPVPSINQNKYLLVICDEFSKLPFAFVSKDFSSHTAINHYFLFSACHLSCKFYE